MKRRRGPRRQRESASRDINEQLQAEQELQEQLKSEELQEQADYWEDVANGLWEEEAWDAWQRTWDDDRPDLDFLDEMP